MSQAPKLATKAHVASAVVMLNGKVSVELKVGRVFRSTEKSAHVFDSIDAAIRGTNGGRIVLASTLYAEVLYSNGCLAVRRSDSIELQTVRTGITQAEAEVMARSRYYCPLTVVNN